MTRVPHDCEPPVPATALIVDLRNFTANLAASGADDRGVNRFCPFLAQFYGRCLDACRVALPPHLRAQPPLFVSSTGDGVLVVFTGDGHVRCGFLAALLLHHALAQDCRRFNARRIDVDAPAVSFGIGMESGPACRVWARVTAPSGALAIDTWIADCINIAARVEAITKTLHDARTLVSGAANDLLCRDLFQESYGELVLRTSDAALDDGARLALHDRMNELNRRLCVSFLHFHALKGVDRPLPLFRLSRSAHPGNARFAGLLEMLASDPGHLQEISAWLAEASA